MASGCSSRFSQITSININITNILHNNSTDLLNSSSSTALEVEEVTIPTTTTRSMTRSCRRWTRLSATGLSRPAGRMEWTPPRPSRSATG